MSGKDGGALSYLDALASCRSFDPWSTSLEKSCFALLSIRALLWFCIVLSAKMRMRVCAPCCLTQFRLGKRPPLQTQAEAERRPNHTIKRAWRATKRRHTHQAHVRAHAQTHTLSGENRHKKPRHVPTDAHPACLTARRASTEKEHT